MSWHRSLPNTMCWELIHLTKCDVFLGPVSCLSTSVLTSHPLRIWPRIPRGFHARKLRWLVSMKHGLTLNLWQWQQCLVGVHSELMTKKAKFETDDCSFMWKEVEDRLGFRSLWFATGRQILRMSLHLSATGLSTCSQAISLFIVLVHPFIPLSVLTIDLIGRCHFYRLSWVEFIFR